MYRPFAGIFWGQFQNLLFFLGLSKILGIFCCCCWMGVGRGWGGGGGECW